MIDRYNTPEMIKIWSLQNKFEKFLKVELSVITAYNKLKIIPQNDYQKIIKNSKFNLKEIEKLELTLRHDVIAFIRSVINSLGNEGKWIHYQLTSSDVIDTGMALILKEANVLIKDSLNLFLKTLKDNALKYKDFLIIGRTHGIHAEPTSFGLKWALWYDEMNRNLKRFEFASNEIETGKISGSVGNFANVSSKVQDLVCKDLKLNSANISTQVIQRDIYANYLNAIALIASTLDKISIEIRTLQRTEISEVFESFAKNQQGSSSMPHKVNPISSENISGISRILRGYLFSAYENIPLWNERDISHSSSERIFLPDATSLIYYSLNRYGETLKTLIVDKDKMEKNIWLTNGRVFSQKLLSMLISKDVKREIAYPIIQKLTFKSKEKNLPFKEVILEEKLIKEKLSNKEIEEIFDYKYYLKEVNNIYSRVFK